ncbi:hypothetical protein V8E53_008704 [Lactarius tabidus]
MDAHNTSRSVFLEHARNIGRAYQHQALELIYICQLISRLAPPKLVSEDAELRRMRQVCDLALRSAADSGTNVTDEANARFEEATRVLRGHSEGRRRLDLPLTICSKMEIARLKDSVQWRGVDEWGPTISINFVILRSPLLNPHDPETIIVSQELSASPSFPEILWNFSRYKDCAHITLEQNPSFYLRCPADESAYAPTFQRHPLRDPGGALEHNDTVYVLFDRPGRVFLDTEPTGLRIFGNVWSLNGALVFRDSSGVLEGERLVRSIQGNFWYCEQPVAHHDSEFRSRSSHSCLRPVVTTPPADPSAEWTFEDWTLLTRPASHSIDIHIYGSRRPGSTTSLDVPPPPPTSVRPGYHVLYTSMNTLDDEILLSIFNYYRLDGINAWNDRLGWCKLSHVCRRWRHLVHCSISHLGMRILCTKGAPIVDKLEHLPPLPLFIDFRDTAMPLSGQDELGIYHALLLRDRIRHMVLHLPPSILHRFLMLMDGPFTSLEHLSLSSIDDEIASLILPKDFRAPKLRHLTLLGVGLPKGLSFLSTVSLTTLALTKIRASGYFLPGPLVRSLHSLPQLEELTISFSIPIPRPGAERELLGAQETMVTLPSLKQLTFQGVSAYLEYLVAQIRAPLLEWLSITLFGQVAFALPHLSHSVNITERLKSRAAEVRFGRDAVSLTMNRYNAQRHEGHFVLCVTCKQLDWQIDWAAQIYSALMPALSGVEALTLAFYEPTIGTEWQNGGIDSTTWHDLLRPFIGVEELDICGALSQELSRALELDNVGLDPRFLPSLQVLKYGLENGRANNLFSSFVDARQVAGRPVSRSSPSSFISQTTPNDDDVVGAKFSANMPHPNRL